MFSLTTTIRAVAVATAFAGCLLGASSLSAQDSSSPPPGPPPGGRMMRGGGGGGRFDPFKGITLTADQKTKLDDIRAKYRKQMDSLRTSGSNDRGAFRGLMEAQMKESRGVLTAEQQKVYDANAKELQERMKERMQRGGQGGGDAPPPPPPPPQQ